MDELERVTLVLRVVQLAATVPLCWAIWRLWRGRACSWRNLLALVVLVAHMTVYQIYALLSFDLGFFFVASYTGAWTAVLRLHVTLTLLGYTLLLLKRAGVRWIR